MPLPELIQIINAFNKAGVRYMLASPFVDITNGPTSFTAVVELYIDQDDDNLRVCIGLLNQSGYAASANSNNEEPAELVFFNRNNSTVFRIFPSLPDAFLQEFAHASWMRIWASTKAPVISKRDDSRPLPESTHLEILRIWMRQTFSQKLEWLEQAHVMFRNCFKPE